MMLSMRIHIVYCGCTAQFARNLFQHLLDQVKTVRDVQFGYDYQTRECRVSVPAGDTRALELVLEIVRTSGVAPHHAVLAESYTLETTHTAQTVTDITYWVQHATPHAIDIRPYIHSQITRA